MSSMTSVTRARISNKMPSAPVEEKLPSSMSFEQLNSLKRLSGFCLAQAGARAFCLNQDDAPMHQVLAELKPSLEWVQRRDADIMVGSGVLQKIYTHNQGGWKAVRAYLSDAIDSLPVGGRLVLRENALLVPEEMVLLELPDHRGKYGKKDPSQLAIRRLQDFSKHARPWIAEEYRGFFLEEMPSLRPDTRMFNLPIRWAAEFLMRKDFNDDAWAESMNREFILGNERMLRTQVLNPLGLRVILNAPHWDKETYDKKRTFQLYKDDEHHSPMPPPPTELVIVAEKTASSMDGLWLAEQRASREEPKELSLITLQKDDTGDTVSLVSGLEPDVQVLPWRYLSDGTIGIYLHKDRATPMVNAKPRTTSSIDGRRFSGYLPAPLHISADEWEICQRGGAKKINKWLESNTGMAVAPHSEIIEGKMSYPAPDFIDQAMQTIFVEVKKPALSEIKDMECYDANDLLQAIHAGLLPLASLEAQLWQLAELAKVHLTIIVDKKVDIEVDDAADDKMNETSFEALCRTMAEHEDAPKTTAFKPIRGNSSDWRVARSTFLEETVEGPRQAIDQEFVLSDEEPLHKAALMCLSRRMSGEVLAGFEMDDCPVPSRYGKPGKMMRLPTVPLPNNLRSIPEAREYLAKLLEVDIKHVVPSGQAVFTHAGVTPQKIFPFMVTQAPWFMKPKLMYTTIDNIRALTHLDNSDSFLWVWGLALAQMCDGSELNVVNNWENRASIRESRHVPEMQLRVIAKNYG